jgi:hypothetical protein
MNEEISLEEFTNGLRLMTAERVRQHYLRNRDRILQERHVEYFRKKKLKRIPARHVSTNTKYLNAKVDGDSGEPANIIQ